MSTLHGRVLVEGSAVGAALSLAAPISFWGGVDPKTGKICDPRHPNHGESIAGRVMIIPETIGSSSSSAILLELLKQRIAPAAILLGSCDVILVLGVLVAKELGYRTIPVLEEIANDFVTIPSDATVTVSKSGEVAWGKKGGRENG